MWYDRFTDASNLDKKEELGFCVTMISKALSKIDKKKRKVEFVLGLHGTYILSIIDIEYEIFLWYYNTTLKEGITMLWKKEEKCPIQVEDGIVMDFVEGRFVILVKDDLWSDFECQALQKNRLNVYFLYERVCAIFLLENVDSIDTSDIIFDIHNCAEKEICMNQDQYEFEIYLVEKTDKICAVRSATMDKANSSKIKEALLKQSETPYDEAGFDRALAKLQGTYEPFEMEELAIVKASF